VYSVSGILLLLSALMAAQGQAVAVRWPHEPGLEQVSLTWEGRTVPMVRAGGEWRALIGIDLDASAGEHMAAVVLEFGDGHRREASQPILVLSQEFPVTRLTVAPKYVAPSPEDQARAAEEAREIAAIYASMHPDPYWSEPFMAPLPDVSGGRNFGHRRVFNGEPRAPHSGADLSAGTGTPIYAANRGRVVLAKPLFYSGNAVFVDHGQSVYSAYLHLSEIRVQTGDMVERGALLGLSGATGRVTGPHLHWGARVLGARVDPFSLLSATAFENQEAR
jgi:murein DD-endopeptidase MepM/ murein hydrolase activator NlpD